MSVLGVLGILFLAPIVLILGVLVGVLAAAVVLALIAAVLD